MTDTPLTAEDVARFSRFVESKLCYCGKPVCLERRRVWQQIAALTERAEQAERDRDKAETTLEMVKALADGYGWLSEGRGSYEWDDGRYDDDVRTFTGQLLELLPSGNWLGMREWEAKYRKAEARVAELEAALKETSEQLQQDFAIKCRCDFVTKLPAGIERCVGCRARDRIAAIAAALEGTR